MTHWVETLWLRFKLRPKSRLKRILPDLLRLHKEMDEARTTRDPLDGIVRFFQATSPWHDRMEELQVLRDNLDKCRHDPRMVAALTEAIGEIQSVGRSRFGWNRTEKGSAVTPFDIFLGGVSGTFTHHVSFWKNMDQNDRAREIVSAETKHFMTNHCRVFQKNLIILSSLTLRS